MHILFIFVCLVVATSQTLRGLVVLLLQRRGMESLKYFGAALSSIIVGGAILVVGMLLVEVAIRMGIIPEGSRFPDGQLSSGDIVRVLFAGGMLFVVTVMGPIVGARFGFRAVSRIISYTRPSASEPPK